MVPGKGLAVAVGLLAVVLLGSAGALLNQRLPAAAPADLPKTNTSAHVDRAGDPLPAGVVARLGTVRFRHEGNSMAGLAFFPDGKTIVSAGGYSVRVWDATTGRQLREYRTHPLSIGSFCLSADGKRFAVGGPLRVFDAASGKEVRSFAGAGNDVGRGSLAFTPDGKLLLSLADPSGVLRVEEIASGVELLRHSFPRGIFNSLAVSRDGETLAVASGKLFVWKWQSGEEPRQLPAGDRVGRQLCFSPDGKRLAECGDLGSTIRLWDVAGGKLVYKLEPPRDDWYSYSRVAFTPDGKTLVATGNHGSGDGAIDLWDPVSGQFRKRIETPGVGTGWLAVSPDGTRVATGRDPVIRVWDLASGKEVAGTNEGHLGWICRVVAAPGVAATAGYDHTVRVWDVATGRQRLRLRHDKSWVLDVALSPDGKHLVSSSMDDTVRLWDLATGREIYRLPGHGEYGGRRRVGFTADGRRFLSWGDDFFLRVWDVKTGKAIHEHRIRPTGVKVPDEDADLAERNEFSVLGEGAFSADAKVFVLAIGARAFVFDASTAKEVRVLDTGQRDPQAVALSPDGKRFLIGGMGKAIQTRLTNGSMRRSTAKEHLLELWDLTAGKRLWSMTLPGSESGPVAFSPDGKTMATTVDKPAGRIRLWDVQSGEERPAIGGLPGWVTALTFTTDGRHLITAMSDTSALVWDLSAQGARKP